MMKYIVVSCVLLTAVIFPGSAFSMGGAAPSATQEAPVVAAPKIGVQVIRVTAKQFEYVPNPIRVKGGIPVRLIITSQDVTHGFAIDALNINAKVEKGKDTVVEFTPNKPGSYDIYCNSFCGLGHFGMHGKLIVK